MWAIWLYRFSRNSNVFQPFRFSIASQLGRSMSERMATHNYIRGNGCSARIAPLTSTGVHHAPIADDEAILLARGRQIEERVLDLNHRLQEVLLELDRLVLGQVSELDATTGKVTKGGFI